MKDKISHLFRIAITCITICFFSINPTYAATTVDASSYNSSELEMHKAIIFSALHYQWEITEQTRDSFKLKYKNATLNLKIKGQTIAINPESKDTSKKWLARLKKLIERRLNYQARVRKAKSLIK